MATTDAVSARPSLFARLEEWLGECRATIGERRREYARRKAIRQLCRDLGIDPHQFDLDERRMNVRSGRTKK